MIHCNIYASRIYLNGGARPINRLNAPWHLEASEIEYVQYIEHRYGVALLSRLSVSPIRPLAHSPTRSHPPSEIHIRSDSWQRRLIVEDNGAGMTEEEVKQFLTVIGSSRTDLVRSRLEQMGRGDMAQRLIGRFGLGLLSAFIIGDRVEFL